MSSTLPTGTVTFLFTDVEGSTRRLEELGAEAYAVELGRHREIVRAALEEHGGVEVDTQGDAFFCAFPSARAAVACAGSIQNALAGGGVRIRMGIHTGEALLVDRHYVGMDVHRAARIGACGHGGQVVLSPSTVALLEPGEFVVRDLGAHRLKDLAAPVVLSQLGSDEHPPLKALFRTNLPVPATPFLGRDRELEELVELASAPSVRVLTLTGPGGTGKTRLSLQLAAELSDEYPDGVWWVPLAPLRDGALVASAVAQALDVDEEPGRELVDSIANAVARKRMLLLLDNCEHVVEPAAGLVGRLVGSGLELFVVATSREPLAVSGENVFAVQPLVERDAIELFHARAHAAGARLERTAADGVVTELCARLDNLPLAVELAAARTSALPPAALLDRLSGRLDVLSGPRDADERQRTLRATIAWSYDLLDEGERRLFRSLAVFVGGASLSAIEAVCAARLEDLLSLVSKSLVRPASTEGDEPRYFVLETIREFAAEELGSTNELDALHGRHVDWYAGLARDLGGELDRLDSGEHLLRLELDLENLRAAFERAVQPGEDRVSDAVALALALVTRHFLRGRYAEAETVARQALELDAELLATAHLLEWLGVVLRLQGRPREAMESYRAAEDVLEGASSRDETWWERWLELKLNEAHYAYFQNEMALLEEILDALVPAIAEHGSTAQRLDLLHVQAQRRYRLERYAISEETEALARRLYELSVEAGDVSADFTLGFCLLWRGKPDEARVYLERGREVARERGAALIETRCLVYGLVACRKLGDVEGARALLEEIEALDELHGYGGLMRASAAWIAYRDGDLELAARKGVEALADWRFEGRAAPSPFQWTARFPLLAVAVAREDLAAAREHGETMLGDTQQPLPAELEAALEAALGEGDVASFARVLELARPSGYV